MTNEWWRGAVIYQIYPRSFCDSNGDGVGDLPGITRHLDYIAELGVDAVWLSPFFKSPMKDFGYDVSDYRDVDPMFGTLDDFRELLDRAHKIGLKVIIDQVMSHTSDAHAWFQESRMSRDNPKANWYVWADPNPDGTPPNNWQSVFGGPSWDFEMRRGQYYMHNFLKEQPDLNLHNPEVQNAILAESAFWLDMGVDGFRLDALNFTMHNRNLEDNPINPVPKPAFFNIDFSTPYTMQLHVNDMNQPEVVGFVEKIRALLDRYDGERMAVAEVGGENAVDLAVDYTEGENRLHTAYNFSLISGNTLSADYIRSMIQDFENNPGDSWPSWAFSNHDVTRVVTRWGGDRWNDQRLAKLLIAILFSLRGSGFLYQGEELGLPDANIPYEKIQDPWGKYLYPLWQGRDGCRTPMPWDGKKRHAGFSDAESTWLPIDDRHVPLSAATQNNDENSTLNFTRAFLKWRKTQPALVTGAISFLNLADEDILGLTRRSEGQKILCLFNLSDQEKTVPIQDAVRLENIFPAAGQTGIFKNGTVTLPPYGLFFSLIAPE